LTAEAFLSALQLADSSLPVGRFVHSAGLERWLAANPDAGDEELSELIATLLVESIAPLDAAALGLAHAARTTGRLIELDELLTAHKPLPPHRAASRACGRQLAALGLRLTGDELAADFCRLVGSGVTDGNLAIVEGTVARALGLTTANAILVELRGTTAGMLSAAVRLGRLSAIRAQVILHALAPVIVQAQVAALGRSADELRAMAPELDIAALEHARADVRLFAT
jgi:urease accessory protein